MDLRNELEDLPVHLNKIEDRRSKDRLSITIPLLSTTSEPVTESEKINAYYRCGNRSCDRLFLNPENASSHFCWDLDLISSSIGVRGLSKGIMSRSSLPK
jgi:hypothetical protein